MEKPTSNEAMGGVNRLNPNDVLLEEFVNLSDLLARVEDDRELLAELLMMFQQECPGLLDALHHAMDVGDLPAAANAAHTLKVMLANLSMTRGASLAATFEAAARAGNLPATLETMVSLDSEIGTLSAALDVFLAGK